MFKINVSPLAIQDMKSIKQYIQDELLNVTAAKDFVQGIYEKIELLQDFPLIGAPLYGKVEIQNDYRYLTSGNYLIFYRFENQEIYVVRIIYGKSDYMKILFV